MQKPNPQKRRRILDAAARLFAAQRYHDVRLEDVAQEAQVGKGTIYIYFESKDELYLALVDEGFTRLVAELRESGHARGRSALVELREILQALVRFAVEHPHLVELMRSTTGGAGTRWSKARSDLTGLLEEILRRGVRRKELRDPDPALTALCIPGLVRSAIFFGPRRVDEVKVVRGLMRLLEQGIAVRRGA